MYLRLIKYVGFTQNILCDTYVLVVNVFQLGILYLLKISSLSNKFIMVLIVVFQMLPNLN